MTFGISRGVAVDDAGNVQAGVWVEVRRMAPGFPLQPQLYEDANGAAGLSNPFFSVTGEFAFYCVGGTYRVTVTRPGFSKQWDDVPVGSAQAADVDAYATAGFTWAPESATSAPPTAGCIRANNADWTLATHIFVRKQTLGGSDATAWLDRLQIDDDLMIATGVGIEISWPIVSITEQSTYFDFEVDAGAYAGPAGPLTLGDSGFVTVSQGRKGSGVTDGNKGDIVVSAAGSVWSIGSSVLSSFWRSVISTASASLSWVAMLVLGHLATRTALKAIAPTAGMAVYLSEAGREGPFVWRAGNYSAQVTADTLEGVYVKATSVAASSGAWVRAFVGPLQAKWFGVVGDGTTNDTAAIQAAETARAALGAELLFAAGSYLTDTITVSRANGGAWCGHDARLLARSNSTSFLSVSGAVTGSGARKFEVSGLSFDGNSKTNVTVYLEAAPYLTVLRNLQITNVQYAGVFNRGRGITLENIQQYGSGCWLFSGVGTGTLDRIFDINISNINHQSLGAAGWASAPVWFYFYRAIGVNIANVITASLDGAAQGIKMEGAVEGVFISNTIIVFPTTGISAVVGADAVYPSYVYMSNAAVDQPTADGIDLEGLVFRLQNVNVTFGDVRTNSGGGLTIRDGCADVWIAGIRVSNMYNSGLVVETGATGVKITGADLTGNHFSGSGYDLELNASTAANVTLYGKNVLGTVHATGQVLRGGETTLPVYPGVGSFAAGVAQIYQNPGSGGNGLVITAPDAGSGATNDFGFFSATGGELIVNPHGTNNVRIGGGFGMLMLGGALSLGAPVTKTANFTWDVNENWIINNKSGSSCTATLPAAGSWSGRMLMINNIQAQTVISASGNVVPKAGGAAGTAILPATAGAWAILVSDGTNWKIMMSGT